MRMSIWRMHRSWILCLVSSHLSTLKHLHQPLSSNQSECRQMYPHLHVIILDTRSSTVPRLVLLLLYISSRSISFRSEQGLCLHHLSALRLPRWVTFLKSVSCIFWRHFTALDMTVLLPLVNSLTHLTYLTSTYDYRWQSWASRTRTFVTRSRSRKTRWQFTSSTLVSPPKTNTHTQHRSVRWTCWISLSPSFPVCSE